MLKYLMKLRKLYNNLTGRKRLIDVRCIGTTLIFR